MMQNVILDNNQLGLLSNNPRKIQLFFSKYNLVVPCQCWFEMMRNNKALKTLEMMKKFEDQVFFLDETVSLLEKNLWNQKLDLKKSSRTFSELTLNLTPKKYLEVFQKEPIKLDQIKQYKIMKEKHEAYYNAKSLKSKIPQSRGNNKILVEDVKKTFRTKRMRLEAFKMSYIPETYSSTKTSLVEIQRNKNKYIFWHYYCNAQYFVTMANLINQKEQIETGLYPFRQKPNFLSDLEILTTLCFADIIVSADRDFRGCTEYLLNDLKVKNKKILCNIDELFFY